MGPGAGLGLALSALAFGLAWASREATVSFDRPLLLDSLFSSRHGLLFWTPVLTVGLLGLFARAGKAAKSTGALVALGVLVLLNAGSRPWWSGWLGNTRILPALALFALGLAHVLEAIRTTARRRPLRLAALAGAAMVGWNLLLMAQYRAELIPRDDTVSFPAVAENSARLLAAAAGAPTSWPANWVFAARHGLPAARYELLAGQDVLGAGPARFDLGDLAIEASFLGEGWSVRHPCPPAVCREVEGRARLFLPVVDPRPAEVRVSAQGSGTLRVSLNGALVAQGALGGAATDVGAPLDRDRFRRGPNEMVLEVAPGGRALVDAVHVWPRAERP